MNDQAPMTNGSGVVGELNLCLEASSGVLVWHRRLVIGTWSLVIHWSLVIDHWSFLLRRFDQGEFNRGSDIQHCRDNFINRAGFEFLDGGVFGGVVFEGVLDHEHDGFEEDAQRADDE